MWLSGKAFVYHPSSSGFKPQYGKKGHKLEEMGIATQFFTTGHIKTGLHFSQSQKLYCDCFNFVSVAVIKYPNQKQFWGKGVYLTISPGYSSSFQGSCIGRSLKA